ncbi:MAG: hypothetical protein LBE21_04485, partial [Pseudomonadales bacterium]|nr:hypothetical protein [Pseudomonadales bacterium]
MNARWLSWSVRTLSALVLVLALLCALALLLLSTNFGTRFLWRMAQPVALAAGVQLQGEIGAGSLLDGLRLQNFSLNRDAGAGGALTLQVQEFTLTWQPGALFSGRLQIDSVHVQGISGGFRASTLPSTPSAPLTREQLHAWLFELPLDIALDSVSLSGVSFTVGESQIGTESLQFSAYLNHDMLRLDGFDWRWQPYGLSAALQLDAAFALNGALNWNASAANVDYSGALTLGGTLDALTLTHQLNAPQTITSNITLNPGLFAGQSLSFTLQSEAAALDLSTWGVNGARLSSVSLNASGTPAALSAQAALSASYPALPDTNATLTLRWQDGTLTLDALQVLNPELDFALSGAVIPAPLQVQLDWRLNRLDPGARFPTLQLTGVSGNGAVNLAQNPEALLTTIDIASLSGALNGLPLTIQGNAALRGALPEQVTLNAQSGDNRLELNGGMSDTLDLRWNLQAPDLSQLWTELNGTISGAGEISGAPQAP